MAYLRETLLAMLEAEVLARPAVAAAYATGSPRLLVQMRSYAAMLAAISQQIDIAESEPFIKARVGTVLADASLKGILPLAKPARVQIAVENPAAAPLVLGVGRLLIDGRGRRWAVDNAATIAPGGTGTVTATQESRRVIQHTVAGARPFYEVQVPPSDDDVHLAGLDVSDQVSGFRYAEDFCNVAPGERVYHVETDAYRRVWLRFGAADGGNLVIGHQPSNGDVLTITVRECAGEVEIGSGAQFSIEVTTTADEARARMSLSTVLAPGNDPPDVETLRMLARYPGTHDANAVFLADFDFLLRRRLPGFEFLSVWNEQAEEAARGASVQNINTLFVAFSAPGTATAVMETRIREVIARADNTYRVRFVPPREVPVPVTVNASVAAVHDAAAVEGQIRTALLALFGKGTLNASMGLLRTYRVQDVQERLRAAVPALQDQISDFSVSLAVPSTGRLPEDFRFMAPGTTVVNVLRASDAMGLFGY